MKLLFSISIILVWLVMGTPMGVNAGDSFEPWRFGDTRQTVGAQPDAHQEDISLLSQTVLAGLNFFSNYISPVDGDRCPMYPTCASYSRQAVRKHGFFLGIVMTADRLIHEGNEMDSAPLIRVDDRVRFYDPVHWNDYWWYDGTSLEK
ncbi:MAG TPA: membrane protein insertion efficiency factor YidD [Syntrophales bacterium]|nr:membrane protein insertion efficiency factor YidD [Syntrophales bacterium]HPQ44816.1 membrane protein insertion efficiency factor YidD [Syntrophales bacterium]